MKALVIGASGLVGGALARGLERHGVTVVRADRSRVTDGGLHIDVVDRDAVAGAFIANRPDLVLLAVNNQGGVDYCEEHPDEAAALHVRGTENVAVAAARAGARLVYYSSDYVFDGKSGPYAEDDEPRPINAYGRAKWEAEQALRALAPRHLIVRTTAVFGWDRQSPNFAMQVWGRLTAGSELRAPADQWCNPTLAEYLAEASLRLVQMDAEGVVNVVGKDRMTRADLGRALARAMALDPDLIVPVSTAELAQKAPRPLQGGLTVVKLEKLLGTEPLDLAESLKRFRRQWCADTHVAAGPGPASTEAEKLKQEILEGPALAPIRK